MGHGLAAVLQQLLFREDTDYGTDDDDADGGANADGADSYSTGDGTDEGVDDDGARSTAKCSAVAACSDCAIAACNDSAIAGAVTTPLYKECLRGVLLACTMQMCWTACAVGNDGDSSRDSWRRQWRHGCRD